MAGNGNVDGKFHLSFEVRGFDVDNLVLKIVLCCMGHLVTEGLHFAHARMCLEIVDPESLSESLDNKASFEAVYESLLVNLYFEDVAAVDRLDARREWFETEDVVSFEVCNLFGNGSVPEFLELGLHSFGVVLRIGNVTSFDVTESINEMCLLYVE